MRRLDMDAPKYRLVDFTNGNDAKSQPDTRQEHIERYADTDSSDPQPNTIRTNTTTTTTATSNGNNSGHRDSPPPPPTKDGWHSLSRSNSTTFVPGLASYFTPGHHRPGSIYTLSRASFANQLAQLVSLQLPNADLLSAQISAIPTAPAAARALIRAADQIKGWTAKASEVIDGLDSDDDVEWAAAGGREGLADVENAISRFEGLINAYVGAIEELQGRPDVADVAADDLCHAMAQMDAIVAEWSKIGTTLRQVKGQIEIAMEWEELWNVVLGDIQTEKDELARLIFEMEERRHKSLVAAAAVAAADGNGSMNVGDIENTMYDTPPPATPASARRISDRMCLPLQPSLATPSTPTMAHDDSSLLALFARMQPLRASLDFLPMRLSNFETRARHTFPTACDELNERRAELDADYKQLERDAEALRKELGEDRWVLVFRGAGRQAQNMCESVERAVLKLKEAVADRLDLTNRPLVAKKIESYEAKKTHYSPAIERIIGIIDRGIKDRLTVNGEILRLYAEVQARWDGLREQMSDADVILEELQANLADQHLRDSFSSMLSMDLSTAASTNDTPGSSPPSSVIMPPAMAPGPVTPKSKTGNQRPSHGSSVAAVATSSRRRSAIPYLTTSRIPQQKQTPPPTGRVIHDKPWNAYATNPSKMVAGHVYPTPPSARSFSSSVTASSSSVTSPSLLSPPLEPSPRSPSVDTTPSKRSGSRLSFRERSTRVGQQTLAKTRFAASALGSTRRASSVLPLKDGEDDQTPPLPPLPRPASSMASGPNRRLSFLPQPKANYLSSSTALAGRDNPALAGARHAMQQNTGPSTASKELPQRPRWRP